MAGPELTDPTCIYDAATQRFFLVVLTLERLPNNALSPVNHLDLAVSQTSNPNGNWNIYKIDVTNDGTNPSPANACPCLGDYPHIGADANGIYLTTNSYPWNGTGFDGAQIYALSKAQLAAGSPSVNVVHLDTFGTVNAPSDAGPTQPGFTVWPAHSPGTDVLRHRRRRHRVPAQLERGRRGDPPGGRHRRQLRVQPDRHLGPDEHLLAQLGDARTCT